MNHVIVDLESTCWQNDKSKRSEIIEIGAVKITNGIIVEEFQKFIRPIIHTQLSPFCTELTSIEQADVDNSDTFPTVLNQFQEWIGDQDYYLCSWGFYDRKQFASDCELHHLPISWLNNHMSVKHQYLDLHLDRIIQGKDPNIKREKGLGITKALRVEGMTFEGTHHRGIDDARNIAKIFLKHLDKWTFQC